MSITDELRTEARGFGKCIYTSEEAHCLLAIADLIDAEHEDAVRKKAARMLTKTSEYMNDDDLAEIGLVRLPVDADGEYIHIGDVMRWLDEDAPNKVDCMHLCGNGWWVYAHGVGVRSKELRHHHAPTVEDVLREMLKKWGDPPWDSDTDDEESLVAEYAAKLQLREDA